MKKIAILTCLKANDVCTGASCLEAFFKKEAFFNQYKKEDIKLVAFWTCNGCEEVLLNNQEGLNEKLERILSMKTEIVHIGVCTKIKDEHSKKEILCPKVEEIIRYLKDNNIKIIFGTHK